MRDMPIKNGSNQSPSELALQTVPPVAGQSDKLPPHGLTGLRFAVFFRRQFVLAYFGEPGKSGFCVAVYERQNTRPADVVAARQYTTSHAICKKRLK